MAKRKTLTWICWAWLALLLGCTAPPPAPKPPLPAVVPPAPVELECPGGLLCEASAPVAGWRAPQACRPQVLASRVVTCWLQAVEWTRVVEFYQSRYRNTVLAGPLLRVTGAAPPGLTPPLLMAHNRLQGVELVFLAGDQVDTPGAATDTEAKKPPTLGSAP